MAVYFVDKDNDDIAGGGAESGKAPPRHSTHNNCLVYSRSTFHLRGDLTVTHACSARGQTMVARGAFETVGY